MIDLARIVVPATQPVGEAEDIVPSSSVCPSMCLCLSVLLLFIMKFVHKVHT